MAKIQVTFYFSHRTKEVVYYFNEIEFEEFLKQYADGTDDIITNDAKYNLMFYKEIR